MCSSVVVDVLVLDEFSTFSLLATSGEAGLRTMGGYGAVVIHWYLPGRGCSAWKSKFHRSVASLACFCNSFLANLKKWEIGTMKKKAPVLIRTQKSSTGLRSQYLAF